MGVRNREYKEIITLLKHYGCEYRRDGGGSHEMWRNPKTWIVFTVVKPHWWDKISADWTFLDMLEKAWISKDDAKKFKENKFKEK